MPATARYDGQEDHRCDDHLDQLDEGVTQRLQRHAGLGREMPDQAANENRRQHLHIQLRIERLARAQDGLFWNPDSDCLIPLLACPPQWSGRRSGLARAR